MSFQSPAGRLYNDGNGNDLTVDCVGGARPHRAAPVLLGRTVRRTAHRARPVRYGRILAAVGPYAGAAIDAALELD